MKLFNRKTFSLLALAIPVVIFAGSLQSSSTQKENSLAVMYQLKGDVEKKYNKLVEEKASEIGFNVTNPHHNVNNQYEKKWGSTTLENLSFLSSVNDKNIIPLLLKDPRIAGFAPFNMLIYKKKGEEHSHVGHLMPHTMLDILDINDQEIRESFITSFKPLDEMIEKEFSDPKYEMKKSYLNYHNMPKDRMIQFEYTFDRPEDIDDFIEEFQNSFELAFINKGYLIAGYHNFKDNDDDDILEGFDGFWTYSLCHLEFSYNMFDNEGARPEAGLFAPCTMYVYIKAESNTLVFGMPTLHNWTETLYITSDKRAKLAARLNTEIPQILKEYGMVQINPVNPLTATAEEKKMKTAAPEPKVDKAEPQPKTAAPKAKPAADKKDQIPASEDKTKTINITIPKPPKVPTPISVKTIGGGDNNSILDRSIKFSKRVPPNWDPNKYNKKTKEVASLSIPGEVFSGRIAAHLRGKYMEAAEVEKVLKSAGFDIVSTSTLDKKKTLTSVVFTSKELLAAAAKQNRGFISNMRVLVDSKEKRISITNPLYYAKAFMQNDFDETTAKKTLNDINTAFKGLENSKDALKFNLLPDYQFMKGLPKYQDMQTVASGDNLEAKLKDNKRVVFTQKLGNGSTLVGVKLHKRTAKFINKIGTNNAALLPYPVLIEDGKAKILDPKYYIAIMYPMLKMSEFMTIATIPDSIKKDCKRVFR